jgi:hypothetical protein
LDKFFSPAAEYPLKLDPPETVKSWGEPEKLLLDFPFDTEHDLKSSSPKSRVDRSSLVALPETKLKLDDRSNDGGDVEDEECECFGEGASCLGRNPLLIVSHSDP